MKQVLLLLLFVNIVSAEVYQWTDHSGQVHYSTKKNTQSKKAELPEITKGEAVIPDTLLKSCRKHGGNDCSAGPDEDGSVICLDGVKDSAARFLFNCKESKLIVKQISELKPDGNYSVYINNKSAVEAKNIEVKYTIPGSTEEILLVGQKNINAYGLGEYQLSGLLFLGEGNSPLLTNVEVRCENCKN